jgi:hypothetical protein
MEVMNSITHSRTETTQDLESGDTSTDASQISAARKLLLDEVRDELRKESLYAKACHVSNIVLMMLTLATSAGVAIYGLTPHADPKVTGFLALVPGAITVLAGSLKFQSKGHWHYERLFALTALRRSIEIELPEQPTREQIVDLSKRFSEIDKTLNQQWVDRLSFEWDYLQKKT